MTEQTEKRLNHIFQQLPSQEQATLLAFAEFLYTQTKGHVNEAQEHSPQQPLAIPRPAKESVIAAIKRLSQTYPMLDKAELLNETSSLMTAHIIHGKEAAAVIDELEVLFSHHYQALLNKKTNSS